jgi:hypothetical protein
MRQRRHTRISTSEMKNINDVLQQKEAELQQLQSEIEVLRLAAGLLSEDGAPHSDSAVEPGPAPDRPTSGPYLRETSNIPFP